MTTQVTSDRALAPQYRFARCLLPLFFIAVVTACDNEEPDLAAPPTTDQTTHSPQPSSPRAPRVAEPLDASAFVPDPCRSLTAAQQKEFGFDESEVDESDALTSTSCLYRNRDPQVTAGVAYFPEQADGLGHVYRMHADDPFDVWEPMMIDGYPAVRHSAAEEEAQGGCRVSVGITDTLFFLSSITGEPGADNCTAAKNVAKAVLATIKAEG